MSNLNSNKFDVTDWDSFVQKASATVTIDDYTLLSTETITVNGNVLTEGTDFDAEDNNKITAKNLAVAINNLSGFSAKAEGAIVTIKVDSLGLATNAYTLASSVSGAGVTLSGATFASGADTVYSKPFFTDQAVTCEQSQQVDTSGLAGTTPTIDTTPQYSLDGGANWAADTFVFTQVTSAPANESISRDFNGTMRRYKVVLGGTDPIWSAGRILAVTKR